jgi:2'-5' RNA ligase
MPKENLYFIAIVLPQAIAGEIEVFRKDMADAYNSKAALKVMPHITLKAPFKLPSDESTSLLDWFRSMPIPYKLFPVILENFGCFDNKHSKVIYVKPVMSPQLQDLHSVVIKNFMAAYPQINTSTHEHRFNPHVTIAYRDLTPENFEKAWAVYRVRNYTSTFTCESFCLLKHNGLRWEIIAENFLPDL